MRNPVPTNRHRNESQSLMISTPSIMMTTGTKSAPVIAYVISLVKCGDRQSSTAGLIDAALVLRHSVHLQSIRNPASGSKYDYHMYAIVHSNALECSQILKTVGKSFNLVILYIPASSRLDSTLYAHTFAFLGFTRIIADTPIQQKDIKSELLRTNIHREWCCGHHEFIKLEAYNLVQHPVVVHVDIDFLFLKPMDILYDAIVFDKDSELGAAARRLIPMERPHEMLPDTIDTFITRDWPQVVPGRKPGYQAGFVVLRPDPTVPKELYKIILEGNFTPGFSRENGWGGLGYGSFVGAMAMQGLMAYYYDIIRPQSAVELNQCRYNWMGMDVLYRAQPNFSEKLSKTGMCRSNKLECEQCYETNTRLIHNVHFTQCRKPWNCVGLGEKGGDHGKKIDTGAGNYEKCMEMVTKWHEIRLDFETKLFALTKDDRIMEAATKSDYKVEIFRGHCAGEGGSNYSQIDASQATFAEVPKMYQAMINI